MIAYQKMSGENGLQNALFPLEDLYVLRYHHKGDDYILDLWGYVNGSHVLKCPIYAPVDMKCVKVGSLSTNEPTVTWESLDKVNFVDGTIDYLTLSLSHDDNFSEYTVGEVIFQGEIIGHTGTAGQASTDHTHLIGGKGKFTKYISTPLGQWTLENQYPPDDIFGVNDTTLVRTEDPNYPNALNWEEFIPYVPPEPTKKDDFIIISLVNAMKWSV